MQQRGAAAKLPKSTEACMQKLRYARKKLRRSGAKHREKNNKAANAKASLPGADDALAKRLSDRRAGGSGKTFAFVFLRSLLYKAELRFSFRLIRPASQGGYAPFFGCPRPRFSFNGAAAQSAVFRILAVYLISAVGTLSQPMQEIWPGRDMVMTPL